MTDPANVTADYQKFVKEKRSDFIEGIYKTLVVDAPVKQIPESVFINEILPIVTNKATNTEIPVLVAAVAGNPFLEIDIVNHKGEVLFRMPSLLERNAVDHKEASKRGSINNMLITANQLSKLSPKRAAHYLAHEFNGRGIGKNNDTFVSERSKRWNDIFARYGVVPGNNNNNMLQTTNSSIAENKKVEVNIDDGDLF